MKPLLYALPGNEDATAVLARELGGEIGTLEVRRFPDGECYVRLHTPPQGRSVALVCTLDRPDRKSIEVYFAAAAARELGAARVGLVTPYLAYMRQDARLQPGEGITSVYYGRWLSQFLDWLVTVDPHLHRHPSLDRVYSIPTAVAAAAPAISRWIAAHVERPVVIGPDAESAQWAERIAGGAQCPCVVATKERTGDFAVEVALPELAQWSAHTPVLVDDIVSTGRTMIAAITRLRPCGIAGAPVCIGVHALFAADAHDALWAAGAAKVVTCNTIVHATNAIDVLPEIVGAVRPFLADGT